MKIYLLRTNGFTWSVFARDDDDADRLATMYNAEVVHNWPQKIKK